MFERHKVEPLDPGLADLRRDLHRKIRVRRHPSRARRRRVRAQRLHRDRPHARRAGAEDQCAGRGAARDGVARHDTGRRDRRRRRFLARGETELNRFNGDRGMAPIRASARSARRRSTPSRVYRPEIAVSTGLATDADARRRCGRAAIPASMRAATTWRRSWAAPGSEARRSARPRCCLSGSDARARRGLDCRAPRCVNLSNLRISFSGSIHFAGYALKFGTGKRRAIGLSVTQGLPRSATSIWASRSRRRSRGDQDAFTAYAVLIPSSG